MPRLMLHCVCRVSCCMVDATSHGLHFVGHTLYESTEEDGGTFGKFVASIPTCSCEQPREADVQCKMGASAFVAAALCVRFVRALMWMAVGGLA